MEKIPKRIYPKGFKEESAQLVLREGLDQAEAARRLSISMKTLANWVAVAARETANGGHLASTGDGLLAALQVLAVLKESDQPMSALARQFEPVPQKTENIRFTTGKLLESEPVKTAIAAGEHRLIGSGRIVVRASGTEPLIRIMAEGDDEKLIGQVVREIASAVKKAAA